MPYSFDEYLAGNLSGSTHSNQLSAYLESSLNRDSRLDPVSTAALILPAVNCASESAGRGPCLHVLHDAALEAPPPRPSTVG
jgi:hypothetical protein